ncbi:carboxypeptidase-like regulatory domain-containing protein [Glycomyces harbinensis]|uniref:Carboxypeptidase regulatory-like domain-containing protein n=1 Tax=Glycomyces harbinensis TaxID=58114 RepID=A0A1G6VSR6_9ACTN|nr:carboxypeptidase-like regulatory domain-containing protein [Glycomyces harbinensis]SDD56730.1 Carboxypeptidase regulatory-like domain-containing protein [Glycomyces harbinensis]
MTVAAEPGGTQTSVPRARRRVGGGLPRRLSGLAVVVGALLGMLTFPQAAMAQGDFTAAITQGHDPQLEIGGATATVVVDVTAVFPPGTGPKDAEIKASVAGLDNLAYVSVGGGCEASGDSSVKCAGMTSGEMRQVQFIVSPMGEADLPDGQSQTGALNVEFPGGATQTSVTVWGTASASITSISGTVSSNAEPVEGAKLVLTDGEGGEHETETGGDGGYEFTGDGSNPIAPGDMTMVITKDGFEEKTEEFSVNEGSTTFNRNVTLTKVEAEESSAPPTSAAPTPAEETSAPPPKDTGISGTLIFLIVIGALLVVGGIIGIVFLLRGGKDDKDDDGESFTPGGPPEHQPTAAQVGTPGVYQAGPAPGSEAPTMIHPGGLVDGPGNPAAPTQFGPAYGGSDSTQVMPQAGFGAAPGAPGLGPDGTTILPVVKQPGGPGASDATQIMPQANLSKPPAAAPPSAFADPGATRPHPGPSAPPNPYADPNATRPHPGASAPPSPSAPPNPYADPNATRPHPGVSPYGADPGATRPHPSPTPPPPPATGSMFEPQNPANAPAAQPEQRFGSPSAPQYGPGSQGYGAQPNQPSQPPGYGSQPSQPAGYGSQPGQPSQPAGYGAQPSQPQGYGSHSAPNAPQSAPPGGDPYPSQSMRRDPYAPQEQPAPPTGEYGATRAMPQHGDPSQSQPPAPYGSEQQREPREDEDPDSRRTERRSWGEWDDRPRSW